MNINLQTIAIIIKCDSKKSRLIAIDSHTKKNPIRFARLLKPIRFPHEKLQIRFLII